MVAIWQLRVLLVLPLGLSGYLAAPAGKAWANVPRAAIEQQLKAASEDLETARAAAIDAQLQLAELQMERRLQELTPPVAVTSVRNPEWDRLTIELRTLERNAQRMAEKLAPAHPEMQAVEGEIRALRAQLETIPESLAPTSPTNSPNRREDLDLIRRIHLAEQNLQTAEQARARAAEEYQQAIMALLTPLPAATSPTIQPVESASSRSSNWLLPATGGCVVALWLLLRKQTSRELRNHAINTLRVDQPVKRIIYSTSDRDPQRVAVPAVAPLSSAKMTRPVIIPRRRSARPHASTG